jgi:hypothetical protein
MCQKTEASLEACFRKCLSQHTTALGLNIAPTYTDRHLHAFTVEQQGNEKKVAFKTLYS